MANNPDVCSISLVAERESMLRHAITQMNLMLFSRMAKHLQQR
jgi:hypothetical protein